MSGANEVLPQKKRHDSIEVRGITSSQKDELKLLATAKFGKPNASLMIRFLVENALNAVVVEPVDKTPKPELQNIRATSKFQLIHATNSPARKSRLEIKITESEKLALEQSAEESESSPQHYLTSLLRGHLTKVPALTGKEITALRESNYQLASIGRNINQVVRKMNSDTYDANTVAKVIDLATVCKKHTDLVADVLRANLERWDIGASVVNKSGNNS